jgi:hypothetical protein
LTDNRTSVVPDLHGIVLYPPGLGHDLFMLKLTGSKVAAGLVEDYGSGAGGSLVNRDYKLFHGSNFLGTFLSKTIPQSQGL